MVKTYVPKCILTLYTQPKIIWKQPYRAKSNIINIIYYIGMLSATQLLYKCDKEEQQESHMREHAALIVCIDLTKNVRYKMKFMKHTIEKMRRRFWRFNADSDNPSVCS